MIDKKHNQDPLDVLNDKLSDIHDDLFGWQDGTEIDNDHGLTVCEDLLKMVKRIEADAKEAKEREYRPVKVQLDGVSTRWAEILKKTDGHRKGILATINRFKQKKLKEHQEAERKAKQAARLAALDAERAKDGVDMKDATQREQVDLADFQARQMHRTAAAIAKDRPKGMRTVKTAIIEDKAALFQFIKAMNPAAVDAFLQTEADKAMRSGTTDIPGVKINVEKVAY